MQTQGRLSRPRVLVFSFAAALVPWLSSCEGDDGKQGPPGPPGDPAGTDTELSPSEDPPGVNVEILALSGASGGDGTFQVGDHVRVTYTVKKDDGTDWDLDELSTGRALLSGPTFNYQRVLEEQSDVRAASVENPDGSYTYTFAAPIPATYLAPVNDSPAFGASDGELAGEALLAGTYTLALAFRWDYTVGGETFRDLGEAVQDTLFLGADTLAPREAVLSENCNRCHEDLRAHGTNRKSVTHCLLCHTAGAEDDNDGGATPGVTVEFKVMIHKIHAAAHLPSVLGVATNPDGSRNYAATPVPYVLSGDDFSDVAFPVWPNLNIAMPRDQGYTALGSPEKALEDAIRMGPTDCNVCHGDPDGGGPLGAPAQGTLAYGQPTRRACGSCHDDIDWTHPYTSNGSTMPAQNDDATCILCHDVAGTPLAVIDAHVHPLKNPLLNPGLKFDVLSATEAGANDGDGTIDPGEKIEVTFNLVDDAGAEVLPALVLSANATFAGPTSNSNLLLFSSLPPAALSGAQPFVIHLPEQRQLEFVGDSTGGADVFQTAGAPHWNVTGALTTVYERTGFGDGASTLTAAATARQNFVDVADGSNFDRDRYVVLDDGVPGLEEYLKIQWVDGDRLWFSSPNNTSYPAGTTLPHAAGAPVAEVDLAALVAGADYTLDPALGTITEGAELGAGTAVVVSYTTDFVVPGDYPIPINDSPDLGETSGEWRGKSLVDGTYTVGLWGQRDATLALFGETNAYRGTSPLASADVLVGSADTPEPYELVSAENCYSCHVDMYFHGAGRRGVETCLACHGTAGAEDRPQYVAPGAPATAGGSVSFREMLHKIHMGSELAHASTYTVVGFGSASLYPNNFSTHTYETVGFPAMPDGVKDCSACHGDSESWWQPGDREHPTEQEDPVLEWRIVCGSCHDSDGAVAHIGTQTDPVSGLEACSICHGEGEDLAVEIVHKVR